jgi:hypothetical protein
MPPWAARLPPPGGPARGVREGRVFERRPCRPGLPGREAEPAVPGAADRRGAGDVRHALFCRSANADRGSTSRDASIEDCSGSSPLPSHEASEARPRPGTRAEARAGRRLPGLAGRRHGFSVSARKAAPGVRRPAGLRQGQGRREAGTSRRDDRHQKQAGAQIREAQSDVAVRDRWHGANPVLSCGSTRAVIGAAAARRRDSAGLPA